MFFHFSIMMIIYKKKNRKFNQKSYDLLFHNIEYNLRESGLGDVAVNKKMKDLNKVLYDILLKIEYIKNEKFTLNKDLIFKYFKQLKNDEKQKYQYFESYFRKFYNFCFELELNNMIRDAITFK